MLAASSYGIFLGFLASRHAHLLAQPPHERLDRKLAESMSPGAAPPAVTLRSPTICTNFAVPGLPVPKLQLVMAASRAATRVVMSNMTGARAAHNLAFSKAPNALCSQPEGGLLVVREKS